ncbi:integrase [Kitasatospora sp. NPDC101155]|uniref:integrase n=1 Tax=Kitasatospora sp. NPDC101155 TaxID=3364097 RepID=UPI0037FA3329
MATGTPSAVQGRCPGCSLQRRLRPDTSRCAWCSRSCPGCGETRSATADQCAACERRAAGRPACGPCARCGRRRILDAATQHCRPCHTRNPDTTLPPPTCEACGRPGQWIKGLCKSCYQRSARTVTARAHGWARRLTDVPLWWQDLAHHLATHRNPVYAGDVIARTARLLHHAPAPTPAALLSRAHDHDPQIAQALTDFFTTHGHLPPTPETDTEDLHAAARRQRRLDATPDPLRPAAQAFADHLLAQRAHATKHGLRPKQLRTAEVRLTTVRDLALHLHGQGTSTWSSVSTHDVEAFLARNPRRRAAHLAGLRQFFAHAHRTGLVLHDPTAPLDAPQHRGFRGPTLTLDHQRALYQRWTRNPDTHPHEAFIGLAALLHAATTTELRHLTDDAVDPDRRTLHFPGRPHPTPLDSATWTALRHCLDHRAETATTNPHILTTRRTTTTHAPAGPAHIRDSLAPVGLLPRILRSTRLLTLAHQLDIELLTASLGMSYSGVTPYLNPAHPADTH